MKKYSFIALVAVLVLALGCLGTAQALVIPPQGMGQIGISSIVIRDGLPVYEKPDGTSKVTANLSSGTHFIVTDRTEGWAEVVLSDDVDAAPIGWVETLFVLVDIGWYLTGEDTPVYPWPDTFAPAFQVIEEGYLLPVLKDEGEWLVVSLNGASGWVHKTEADLAAAAAE